MRAALVVAASISVAGCASVRHVTYYDLFDPPASYLSSSNAPLRDGDVSGATIEKGRRFFADQGKTVVFEGGARDARCHFACLYFRPAGTDDLYYVLTIDSRARAREWFEFAPMENTEPRPTR